MIQSSFPRNIFQTDHISASENGLVYSCFRAYSDHHHLTLRPEDVWFAILSQTGFYVNAHAEELRHLFVAHEGQKELVVEEVGTVDSVDFGALAERMTHLIQENVIDPDLREWIIPDFSTTTNSDRVVASVLMMGMLQKFFTYKMMFYCGIPSVTLLGTKEDWMEIERRLSKLESLGVEAAHFATLLRPILRHFILSFVEPESPVVKDFWSKIVHHDSGSGYSYLSGWITAFCAWNTEGKRLPLAGAPSAARYGIQGCKLDGVQYHCVDTDEIPSGFAAVPVNVDDNGDKFKARMVAGSVGIRATSSGQTSPDSLPPVTGSTPTGELILDSIQPVSGWWMFKVDESASDQLPGDSDFDGE
jgi:hypothetical protein